MKRIGGMKCRKNMCDYSMLYWLVLCVHGRFVELE